MNIFNRLETTCKVIRFTDIRDGSLVPYEDITYENYHFILGPFVKAVTDSNDNTVLIADLCGNSCAAFSIRQDSIIIDNEFKLYLEEFHSIDQELVVNHFRNETYVKGFESPCTSVRRLAPFTELVLEKGNVYFHPVSLSRLSQIYELNHDLLLGALKIFINAIDSPSVLYSGGSDSSFISRLLNDSSTVDHFFFLFDSEYEANCRDLFSVQSSECSPLTIDASLDTVSQLFASRQYRSICKSFAGYSHPLFSFYLAFHKFNDIKENTTILSGQNADTVGYLGPSEDFFFTGFLPRNLRSLISRFRLCALVLWPSRLTSLYWAVYNDFDYSFNNLTSSPTESKYLNALLRDPHLSNLPYLRRRYNIALVAKMRSFGCGNDIKSQHYAAFTANTNIIFPLNNLAFAFLCFKKIKAFPFRYFINPKHWYNHSAFKLARKSLQGTRDYTSTPVFKLYQNFKNELY